MNKSAEMEAFDQLPYDLRRAIDESPWNTCAAWTLMAIQRLHITPEEAARRVRAFACWEDARDYFNWQQDVLAGFRRYRYGVR